MNFPVAAATIAVVTLFGGVRPAAAVSLYFSEYVEGSLSNKALEIHNPLPIPVTLVSTNIRVYVNGSATPFESFLITGTIQPGDVYVIAHPSASPAILAVADLWSSALVFNGDDVVELQQNGSTLDVIGQIGFDPGSEWGTGLETTMDHTLRRNLNICEGDPVGSDVFVPSQQWTGFAVDTFGDLGVPRGVCAAVAVDGGRESSTWGRVKSVYR